jgi:serine/threonine-protein kinase SRPK3
MRDFFRYVPALRRRSPSPLHRISSSSFTTLDSATKIEEERLPHYDPSVFYPVRIGEIFEDRYQVLGKLGFGSSSTVWFCRDLKCEVVPSPMNNELLKLDREHQHVALKVCISSQKPSREVEVLKHLAATKGSHAGAHFVRTPLDSFVIQGRAGTHQCLVMEPLLASLHDLQQTLNPKSLTEDILKTALRQVFAGLDYLHSKAKVVHTGNGSKSLMLFELLTQAADLQAKNIMLSCSNPSIFDSWEKSEIDEPAPRKVDGNRVIYKSREFNLRRDMRSVGRCMITDLGMARIGVEHEGFIQPEVYRAPEVMLCMPWTSAADIWNVGVMVR